ncbi:ARM repeat-containing protein [Leucogyrophana mollusca]|uniref:ARM repeat-containing protein n=1 Tax=Leucogyrophana mollusca TaxID=85980 RepID=A0ACB8BVR9_9AGAM|nr:ARM repeat-containing protein [Leucogyrophana mollusca]
MPRENRKRGKKHKKSQDEDNSYSQSRGNQSESYSAQVQDRGEPSWIVSAPPVDEDVHVEAPFGYVDPDVKSYFRTVDEQIRNWQDEEYHADDADEDMDPNEGRSLQRYDVFPKRIFFVAALTEMSGKEKQLATDPDCSVVMERMAYSMDDFVRRVFVDTLSGSYETLVKHRFASHVCQTLFTVAAETISRESRGTFPDVPESSDKGELRTLTQLILDICDELKPTFTALIMDPFASHVLRALLLLLSPSTQSADVTGHKSQSNVRSKKSTTWKARQGVMKSVFADPKGKDKVVSKNVVPREFHDAAAAFVRTLREQLDENEVRALAANKVASPVLQLILEIEADQGDGTAPGCLMDRILVGIITSYHNDPESPVEQSDYLTTLLRDPTSSHLLETLVARCPEPAFAILWSTYFKGKLARLALHPVANFVLAKALERVSADQLKDALEELEDAWKKILKSARTGVLRALIERAVTLRVHEQAVCEAVFIAFELSDSECRKHLVSCVMVLLPLQDYLLLPSPEQQVQTEHVKKPHRKVANENPREPKVQGALLLQSLIRLSEPHNQLVLDSIKSLPMEELIALAHNAISSRVLDAIFESTTVPFKAKRSFVLSLIGHYHTLVDDRIGSRVGDRCWAFADPYLREKIARSLIIHEQFLAASYYGKYFARNLNLYLLQRRPQDWKNMQSEGKANSSAVPPDVPTTVVSNQQSLSESAKPSIPNPEASSPRKTKKRRSRPEDEIDAVFDAALGKKTRKGAMTAEKGDNPSNVQPLRSSPKKDSLGDVVLGAIRAAPNDESGRGKKRRKH